MTAYQIPTPSTPARVPATRCCHCGRALTSGEGIPVEYVGTLGPECVRKYSALVYALKQVDGYQAYEHDEGTYRLGHYLVTRLRAIGVAVKVVDVDASTKAVQIVGLSGKPKSVIASFAQVRAEFEQRLKLAQAEREAQSWSAA